MSFTVTRTGDLSGTTKVDYYTNIGWPWDNPQPNDFTGTITSQVTFNPGESVKTIQLMVVGDTNVESNETVGLWLSNPQGAVLGDDHTTGTIVNDDTATAAAPAPTPGQTLSGTSRSDNLTGGGGNDTINGGSGYDTITGGAGDDRLDGGSGNDMFVFRSGFGHDTVSGYNAAGSYDQLRFEGFGSTRPDAITQVGSDVSIHFASGDSILVLGQKLSAFTSQDFVYS